MQKILLSLLVITGFAAYSYHEQTETAERIPAVTPSSNSNTQELNSNGTAGTSSQNGTYKDGEYTGPVVDAFYGNIQVKAIIQDGRLTDVQFLQYPNDRPNSIEINERMIPIVRQEAIQSQSANVDIVSGATDSAVAFKQSLGKALEQASGS
jgi:uncharacterized protein with FMN-binding domain